MSHPHSLSVLAHQSEIEAIHPQYVKDGVMRTRAKTISLFNEIKNNLKEGVNELEAREIALNISKALGVKTHWHQPYIRFGEGTALSFHEPLKADNRFCEGTQTYIDLGPVWHDEETDLNYEGDYGDSFVLGKNGEAEKCNEWTRKIFFEAKTLWQKEKLTGSQIYEFIGRRCSQLGYKLAEDFDGHRLSDFPHQKYTKERLAQIPFVPTESFWILELQVLDPKLRFGSFYEDLL